MPGVSSSMITDRISQTRAEVISKEELLNRATRITEGLLIMCGAGDIDVLVEPVKNILENNIKNGVSNK